MGIGKDMKALGEYDFYSSDYKVFLSSLGSLLDSNFTIILRDYMVNGNFDIDQTHEFFDLGKPNSLDVSIAYLNFDENKPSTEDNIYSCYTVTFPVSLEHSKKLDIEFMPDGIFQMDDIPFSGTWNFFIQNIQGVGQGAGEDFIKYVLSVRECYINILNKIGCQEVIIWTDAYYKTEEEILFCPNPNKKHTLTEMAKYLKDLDNIIFYNFLDVVMQNVIIESQSDWYLNVAFIDNFNDKFNNECRALN